ncbi:Sfh5p Ecym_5189 [Eremothecium cymbalariae DBVPG|uniref:Phosphatidylinositol transfer protein SFH5 n=1 Tax=Eremothecium cymbalariae (strain CBS 270.75 / DBVPG 7215 / KCTC 17166 / NRRL Y-17582) TaxID=931890 RepID=I6ND19_ERECY|nr:hypothetical protein Ecym_5189 [Eremothecium cymbalariae DBVPG\
MKFPNDKARETFEKILADLPTIISEQCDNYDELYGYKLIKGTSEETEKYYYEKYASALVYKFAKAHNFEYDVVVKRLVDTLNWRKEFKPLRAGFVEDHDSLFSETGIITNYPNGEPNLKVLTWNMYGRLTKKKGLLKDNEKFIRYRIGLMERGLQLLDFVDEENNYMTQIHDYEDVSLFGYDHDVKKCAKTIVDMFQAYYPEMLYAKYFVNVPLVMGWIYDLVKSFVPEETRRKFVVLNSGKKLGQYIKNVPTQYGGKTQLNLEEDLVDQVKPTDYALYLLQKDMVEDLD